jgi:tRNA-Thr(GGU) m(6)t(6)A37 methyltransferase TsaA
VYRLLSSAQNMSGHVASRRSLRASDPKEKHNLLHNLHGDYRRIPEDTREKGQQQMSQDTILYTPIGVIHTQHTVPEETPIQPVFAAGCQGTVELFAPFEEGLRDVEGYSHLYLLYHLHKAPPARLRTRPYLQETERGIFATRAPCRPNSIGLSIVKVLRREKNILLIEGADMLDGTPLLDIKPYSKRFDRIDTERNGWQDEISDEAAQQLGRRGFKG